MFSVRSLTMRRKLRDVGDAVFGKGQVDAFGGQQRDVLLDQGALGSVRMRTNSACPSALELDADRKAALQLGDQVGRLRHMERAGGDEQDVVGAHHAVLGVDRGAFDDRQDVALHALAADVRAVAALAAGDLVDLVDEDDAGLLDALDRGVGAPLPCRSASALLRPGTRALPPP